MCVCVCVCVFQQVEEHLAHEEVKGAEVVLAIVKVPLGVHVADVDLVAGQDVPDAHEADQASVLEGWNGVGSERQELGG